MTETVLKNFYVNNCLKSVSSRAVAVRLRVELIVVCCPEVVFD